MFQTERAKALGAVKTLLVMVTLSSALLSVTMADVNNNEKMDDCMEPYCSCPHRTTLVCAAFARFEQLDFGRVRHRQFDAVELRAPSLNRTPLLELDERLSLRGLRLTGRLTLVNVAAFAAFYNPFRQIESLSPDSLSLSIIDSTLRFTTTATTIAAEVKMDGTAAAALLNDCHLRSSAVAANDELLFSHLTFAHLRLVELTLVNVHFERPVCALLFRHSRISSLRVVGARGALGFRDVRLNKDDDSVSSKAATIDAHIAQFELNLLPTPVPTLTIPTQRYWLDADTVLNPSLFDKLERLVVNCGDTAETQLAYIQEQTFARLRHLRALELNGVRLVELLRRSRRWLRHLNAAEPPVSGLDADDDDDDDDDEAGEQKQKQQHLEASVAPRIFQLIVRAADWSALAEPATLCLLEQYPHAHLVFPFLMGATPDTLACTCTVRWLYRHVRHYQAVYNLNERIAPVHCFAQPGWSAACHFKRLFDAPLCRSLTSHSSSSSSSNSSSISDHSESLTILRPSTVAPTLSAHRRQSTVHFSDNSVNTSRSSTGVHRTVALIWPPHGAADAALSAVSLASWSAAVADGTRRPLAIGANSPRADATDTATPRKEFFLVTFYLSVLLSLAAAFIIAVLVILFYKVMRRSGGRRSGGGGVVVGDNNSNSNYNSTNTPFNPAVNVNIRYSDQTSIQEYI